MRSEDFDMLGDCHGVPAPRRGWSVVSDCGVNGSALLQLGGDGHVSDRQVVAVGFDFQQRRRMSLSRRPRAAFRRRPA